MRKLATFLLSAFLMIIFSPHSAAAENEIIASVPGQIAYVGADNNIYVLSPQTNSTRAFTQDGSPEIQYRWPTWSSDGRLAYFLTRVIDQKVETDVFVATASQDEGQIVYQGDDEVFTYAAWAPQNYQEDGCRDLAVLLSNLSNQDFSVKLIHDGNAEAIDTFAGTGAPFYYSWSPDGRKMLWQRNNATIDIYDAGTNKLIDTLPQLPGYFQAPAWSPIDNRWLIGSLGSDRQSTNLVIVENNQTQTLASKLSGPISFSWSPDGSMVAYVENTGVLFVVNAHTGEVVSRSPVSGVYAFFWSPDSKNIAYITVSTSTGSFNAYSSNEVKVASIVQAQTGIAWSIMDIASGATRRYGAFVPTQEMIYLLSFFDQFSQSHRIWSPDSRYLIYGEVTPNKHQVISILDTSQDDTVPFSIAEGIIGIWSFN